MIIVNSIFFPFTSFFCGKGGEAAGTQRLSKSKKWYCHTSRMAVWCLFKRGGKKTVQAIESYLLANTSLRSHLHHYSNMFYFQHCCSQWLTSQSHVLLSSASDPLNMGRVVMRNSLLMHQRMHSDCMKFELDIVRTEICWIINLLGLSILNHKNKSYFDLFAKMPFNLYIAPHTYTLFVFVSSRSHR